MSRLHGLIANGSVRFVAVEVSAVADEVRERHKLGDVAAKLASEATVATALLSAFIKGEERITLQLQVEHPRASFAADLNADGRFRARFSPTNVPHDGAEMNGVISVIKSDARSELYRGATAIEHEDLTSALRDHLARSAQVNGRLGIVVEPDEQGIGFAGGFWIERLPADAGRPSMSPEEFDEHFDQLESLPVRDVLEQIRDGELLGMDVKTLDHQPVDFDCWCSRERVSEMLTSLGTITLRSLIDEDGGAEVICHFCTEAFAFDVEHLEGLFDTAIERQGN